MDGILSQEEINALLNNKESLGISEDEGDGSGLSDIEKDAIGEIANISMGTAATTLFSLVNQKVVITTPVVSYIRWEDIVAEYEKPCVFIQISYTIGLDGSNILVLRENDVKIITDLMMGGDGTNTDGELTDLHLSAISEAMNQMMGSSATSLSTMLNKKIDISPPTADIIDLNETIAGEDIDPFLGGQFVKISFKMEIGDLVDSEIMQLYPLSFAKEMYESYQKNMYSTTESEKKVEPELQPEPQPVPQPQMAPQGMLAMDMQQGYPQQPYMQQGYPQQPVNIQTAQFQPFDGSFVPGGQSENISLIMDVPLEVTVELGRTTKSIQDILEFAPGTIIELDKIAGEPIDVLVNGKYVAKGEVVVIEESFGVRVTEIIKSNK